MTCPWCSNTGTIAGDGCVACASGGRTLHELQPHVTITYRINGRLETETLDWRLLVDALDKRVRRGTVAEEVARVNLFLFPVPGEQCEDEDGWCDGSCAQLAPPHWNSTNRDHDARGIPTCCLTCGRSALHVRDELLAVGASPCIDDAQHSFRGVPRQHLTTDLARRKRETEERQRERERLMATRVGVDEGKGDDTTIMMHVRYSGDVKQRTYPTMVKPV